MRTRIRSYPWSRNHLCMRRGLILLLNTRSAIQAIIFTIFSSVCAGNDVTFEAFPQNVAVQVGSFKSIGQCNAGVLSQELTTQWIVNGVTVSEDFNVTENGENLGYSINSKQAYSLIKSTVTKDDDGGLYNCRIYNSTSNTSIAESPPARLTVLYPPQPSDPRCNIKFDLNSQNNALVSVSCCVLLTTSPLRLKWVQRPVEMDEYVTGNISSAEEDCFDHVIDNARGSYVCKLTSDTISSVKQECSVGAQIKDVNVSILENYNTKVKLRCDNDATNVIGYDWSIDPAVDEFQLSEDRSVVNFHVAFSEVDEYSVSCTVFTLNSFGTGLLKIHTVTRNPADYHENSKILILIGSICGSVILLLLIIIVLYLIKVRGFCFCYPRPRSYTEFELRQMRLERESLKPNSYNRENGLNGINTLVLADNVNNHLHETEQFVEEEVPPIPGGGNRQVSSSLLNYADLDHGNRSNGELRESPVPERPDQVQVEYADILKPPTQSLRDMT